MRIATVEPDKGLQIIDVDMDEAEYTLKWQQDFVGGYILLALYLTLGDHRLVVMCCEDGHMRGLPPTFAYAKRYSSDITTLYGPVLIMRCSAGGDDESLDYQDIIEICTRLVAHDWVVL
jgi:uncharacterized protein DUF3846